MQSLALQYGVFVDFRFSICPSAVNDFVFSEFMQYICHGNLSCILQFVILCYLGGTYRWMLHNLIRSKKNNNNKHPQQDKENAKTGSTQNNRMTEQMRCGPNSNKEYLQCEQSWSWLQQIRMIPLFTFTLSKCAISRYVFPLWIWMDETRKQLLFIVTQSKNAQMHIQWKWAPFHFIVVWNALNIFRFHSSFFPIGMSLRERDERTNSNAYWISILQWIEKCIK